MNELQPGDIAVVKYRQSEDDEYGVRTRLRVDEKLRDGTLEMTEVGGMGERYRAHPDQPDKIAMSGEKRMTDDEWIWYDLEELRPETLDDHLVTLQERHEDDIDEMDIARANAIIGQLYSEGLDPDWIGSYDVVKARAAADGETAYSRYDKTGTLAVPNEAYKVIWEREILGQISDGAWENYWVDEQTPGYKDDWQKYFQLEVEVDETLDAPELRDGGSVPVQLDYLGELTEHSGHPARMIFMARFVGFDDFDESDLHQVLAEFGQM